MQTKRVAKQMYKALQTIGIAAAFCMPLAPGLHAQLKVRPNVPPVSGYILGPDDQLSIRVMQAPELIDKPVRIDMNGYLDLPYVGHVKAAGLTPEALKKDLANRYQSIVRDPELSINVDEFRSQPVSVIGAVNTPGVHQLRGRKSLLEVLSMAGGLRQDNGNTISITRQQEYGPTGIRGEVADSTGRYWTSKVDLASLMEGRTPEDNVLVQSNDVIAVSRARMVYVLGDVPKAGGFVLTERDSVSILEALALAGGPNRTAAMHTARILRSSAGEPRREEVDVDLQKILDGKENDRALMAEDILYVPSSTMKRVGGKALEAAIQIGAGLAIWRP